MCARYCALVKNGVRVLEVVGFGDNPFTLRISIIWGFLLKGDGGNGNEGIMPHFGRIPLLTAIIEVMCSFTLEKSSKASSLREFVDNAFT
jgi:hypothetical protein